MGPDPETCRELLRPLRSLMGLKQVALQHAAVQIDPLPYAAAGLLSELVHSGESRASELAQYRVVDASVVSRQVAQLEAAGHITRRPDPSDRRGSLLRATEEGEGVLKRIEEERSDWLVHALSDWDDESVRQLSDLLSAAVADLRQAACEAGHTTDETEGKR